MSRRAEDLKSQGNTCFKNKEYDKARQCYLQALKAGMEDGSDDIMHIIYSNLAHVNNKLGQFKESEKYARLTIRKKPDWFKGYHRAALAAQHLGKLDDAIALLDKGIDNCVANDELKQLKNTLLEQKRRPRSASKPPPPPPLQKVDPQLAAAAAAAPTRSSSKNRSAKASKTTKAASKTTAGETASSASSTASNSKGVWSSLLASSRPAETVSEQTAAAARAGQPDALNEELCITVRRGSVALRRPGGAREAYDEYRKALQQVAKYPKELNLSGNELISLRYCFAMACYEVATQEALSSAEDELLAIIHKTKRPMPAAFYLLGRVYMRLNRFEQAAAVLQLASDILSKDARGDTHVYPGTSEVIPDTESAWRGTLRHPVQELLRRCQYPPRPDALCRLDDCLTHVTVPDLHNPKRSRQERRTAIYYGDVDFAGFIRVQCLSRCRLEYHLACWRQLKERFGSETQRTADKDVLNTPCLTPDCGSNICRIVTIDANGLEKHEIVSDEYKRQQQKQLSKQQKKQAAQAAKKHQVAKTGRKRKDSAPQQSTETDTSSQQPTESAPESAGAAAAAPAAAPAEPELALPPDLREMTVLRRGSNAEEPPAPVGKKSKKKKKKGGTRGWRSATEMFWETTGPEEVYNGPPVNVIYNTSQDDLASRLCQLEDMRTLQFSTRSLIPDTSVQPASVPRDDQSGEEEHAFLESAYQYLYDFLKERGPTNVSDPELLEAVSQLPSYCQELIAQHGSLEAFLTRLPRFYQLDDLVSVEVDVGLAEALLGSAIAERVRAVDTPPPQLDEAECDLVGLGGVSNADTAELEPRSDPEDTDPESEDEERREDEEREDGGECETAAQTQNGDSVQSESAERDSGTADPEDSELADPEDLDAGDPDSTMDLDGDSAEPEPEPEPEPDSTALDGSEGLARDASGGGARGDGAWNTDPELSDDGQESLSQSENSTGTDQVNQLKQQIEALKREKVQQDEQLAEARFTQLRLERTVRQMTQRGAGAPADTEQAAAAQQLVETRQRLVETSGRLSQAEQQRAQALQRGADLSRQLSGVQQQLLTTQQQLAATEQELLATQQQLGAYQQQQGQLEAQLATVHEEAQGYMAQLTEAQQHAAMMEEQAEALASQLAQAPAADTERLHQLERQRDDEEASRRRAEAALEELRAAERRTRGQYVTMLSRAGNELLDTATRRCNDAIRGAERLAAGSGRPDSAQPTVTKLRQALDAVDQSRSQFKEAIKKACKAIASKETIDIQSLKLPEIPDIVETAINGPAGRKTAAAASQSSAARSGASPRPSSRPSSVITVSSGSGSEAGKVSPAPTPPPAAAGVKPSAGVPAGPATAELRAPSPRRAVTPAAMQLSAASRQAAPTTFDALISEIERQFGGAVPGGRDNIIRQFTNYRRRRGGVLRGAARDQIVAEVTAMIRAEAAPAPAAAPAPSAWGQPAASKGAANGVRPEAAGGTPALASIPSKEECVICRESYSTSQARTLECGHRFHELCLRRWLKAQGVMATCPICRHAFTSDTDFPRL
ncbi:E3 ubiquitin-protein ligase TTC3-like isoform X2 [Amphibalanus amphitrite]|uniref:E3 ubiquitin-protein ligase TTC3-like isoform X2 n=1 Tax=Amphibalanus amphitrite TaxID=1232801 RepID=UPI001C926DAB|nr:E3 ubiquitin-protein ligase TTC3-like isoform X2 [Amphibalanus amphitrite]XP_043241582.1 E3 ubiquitin-protein ligase TTC3-like isoform X2 [Amphibalanus amphitrite]